jgi:hypothetical protein
MKSQVIPTEHFIQKWEPMDSTAMQQWFPTMGPLISFLENATERETHGGEHRLFFFHSIA